MKIRLYRGPLDGKVLEGNYGYNEIILGLKKLTREQKYEWRAKLLNNYSYVGTVQGGGSLSMTQAPMVQAEYQQTRLHHPDGSVFYEWTGYSKPYGPQL